MRARASHEKERGKDSARVTKKGNPHEMKESGSNERLSKSHEPAEAARSIETPLEVRALDEGATQPDKRRDGASPARAEAKVSSSAQDEGTVEHKAADGDWNFSEDEWSNDDEEKQPVRQETESDMPNCPKASGIYEGEEELFHSHTDEAWMAFEERFRGTNIMLAFSIDAPTIMVPLRGYWGLTEFAPSIVQVCASKGVHFDQDGVRPVGRVTQVLLARPQKNDLVLWKTVHRGYIKVHGATIWMQPVFTGRKQSNLDLIEIEYTNVNYVLVADLHTTMQRWGAMEALVISHGTNSARQAKWPAITCVTSAVTTPTTGEATYLFRLCFESEVTANAVYQSYLNQDHALIGDIKHGRTIRLKPVLNVEWDGARKRMFRSTAAEELSNIARRLHIFELKPELTISQVEFKLGALGYPGAKITAKPGRTSGTVELQTEQDATRLHATYGAKQRTKICFGQHQTVYESPGRGWRYAMLRVRSYWPLPTGLPQRLERPATSRRSGAYRSKPGMGVKK
ncbi:hypothetical protein BBJ28_00018913 [Nothophytophthora sp. Chile5]|nr:hypothetical protein BBJ28_00018913 [Nothophytophthora sp. Chile5]